MRASATAPLLRLHQVSKRFGSVAALDSIDLEFARGEIHAILGENGAGKSTLMHLVYGLLAPDGGELWLDGHPVRFRSAGDARRAGIGMVHQEFALVDALTVNENLALALSPPGAIALRRAHVAARAFALAERVGLVLGPLDARVGDLPVGVRQRIEIIKALAVEPRILILDEPTAVLTAGETAQLFDVLRALRARGCTILFITHKLNEVTALADRVSVLRRGRLVATVAIGETTTAALAELMIGPSPVVSRAARGARAGSPVALQIDRLTMNDDHGGLALREVTLAVRAGEVFGIAGVDGNGQWQLFQALAGLRQPDGGRIELCGTSVAGQVPATLLAAGMGYIPPDRRRQGAVLPMSVADNALLNTVLLARIARGPFLEPGASRALAQRLIDRFAVRTAGLDAPAASLSGGNLQRLIVGRTLEAGSRVLVAFNPTRGLDVAAGRSISDALDAVVRQGAALLLISTDLDEIFDLCDRVAVLYRGRLSEALSRPFPAARIAQLMAGAAT